MRHGLEITAARQGAEHSGYQGQGIIEVFHGPFQCKVTPPNKSWGGSFHWQQMFLQLSEIAPKVVKKIMCIPSCKQRGIPEAKDTEFVAACQHISTNRVYTMRE